MFIADKVVYIELHKTGSTHIGRLLADTVGGEQVGKHNNPAADHGDRIVLGSVRNPWDWYVSLWAFGCSKQGSVYYQTCDQPSLRHYWSDLPREMMRRYSTPATMYRSWANDRKKPRQEWIDCYQDPRNPALFRRWLRLIMQPERALDVREGFGFCPLANHAGLMTYRYVKLYTTLRSKLFGNHQLKTYAGLAAAFESCRLVDRVIRNEHLEDDLLAALKAAKYDITGTIENVIAANRSAKTNTSERAETDFYYDAETAELVAQRERLIISRHGYVFPG